MWSSPDGSEVSAGEDGVAAHRHGIHRWKKKRGVYVRVPGGNKSTREVQGRDAIPGLTANRGEITAGIKRRAAQRQTKNSVVRVRIPRSGETARRIQCRNIFPRLS